MDALYPGWKSASSGTPTHYYHDKEEDIIGFYVPPDSSNTGSNYAEVYYARTYVEASTDDGTCNLPLYLHMAIVHKVTARGFEQRGLGDKANDQLAKYAGRIKFYLAERKREKEDDELIMKNYRNI